MGDAMLAVLSRHPIEILLLLLLLGAAWFALLYVISRGGWRRFAARYGATQQLPADRFVADEVRFGSLLSPYRSVVRVAFSNEGLYLATVLPFRAFHRPLLIPWKRVKSVKCRNRAGNVRYRIEIEDRAGRILLRLPGTIGPKLQTMRPTTVDPMAVDDVAFPLFGVRRGLMRH